MANEKFILPLHFKNLNDATQDWSDEEFGAYVRLLIHQWSNDKIPSEFKRMNRIAESAEKNWSLLSKKFKKIDGEDALFNEKCREIKDEKLAYQKMKSEIGKKGGRPGKKPNENQHDNQTINLSDNLNETKTETLIEGEGVGIVEEIEESDFERGAGRTFREARDISKFEKWTEQLKTSDHFFEQQLMNSGLKITPEQLVFLLDDHLGLHARYPNMNPQTIKDFRFSALKHIKENKDKKNGTNKDKREQQRDSVREAYHIINSQRTQGSS